MTNYTDEELMSFVKNQDISAFEELFGRYERRVFAFFCRLVWNAEEARDCTQETFLRLWKSRARYAPKGRFSTYIFQIAKNHFLHERQKQKHRIALEHASAEELQKPLEKANPPDSAYSQAVANEIRSAVSNAVTRLPEIHRLVYVLSEELRMSYKQIADILDCPVGTVSSTGSRLSSTADFGLFIGDRFLSLSQLRLNLLKLIKEIKRQRDEHFVKRQGQIF